MLKKIGKNNIITLGLYFLLANFITFPLLFHLTNLATGLGDELLIAWNQGWDIYNYTFNLANILHIFDANIYFPFHNSLAFSDAYFTNSFIATIPVLILRSPIVANNVNVIISLTLVGFFSFKLAKYVTGKNLISFLSGCLIIFSPAFLAWLVHLQIVSVYFVPLSILFLIKYLDLKKLKYLVGFFVCLVLQTYNSFLPGFFIVFATSFICLFYCLKSKKNYKVIFTKVNLALFVISFLSIAIIALPYFKVSREFNYVRDIRDSIHFALQPEDFLVTNQDSRLEPMLSKLPFSDYSIGKHEVKPGFLGIIFSFLSIVSILYAFRNWKKQSYVIKGLMAASLLGLLLSLGPFLHLGRLTIHKPFPIPLPYLIFYYLIPGFQGFRNSARFEIMFMVFELPIIALFLTNYLKKLPLNKQNILVTALILITIGEFNFPMKFFAIPQIKDFPKIYAYLSTTPKNTAIIHLPIYNWNSVYAGQEILREYYSTTNFRKMVNGGSGFSPPPWQNLVYNLLADFPSDNSIAQIKSLGVNLIIVHKSEYDKLHLNNYAMQNKKIASGSAVIQTLMANKNLVFDRQIDQDFVFRIK